MGVKVRFVTGVTTAYIYTGGPEELVGESRRELGESRRDLENKGENSGQTNLENQR